MFDTSKKQKGIHIKKLIQIRVTVELEYKIYMLCKEKKNLRSYKY